MITRTHKKFFYFYNSNFPIPHYQSSTTILVNQLLVTLNIIKDLHNLLFLIITCKFYNWIITNQVYKFFRSSSKHNIS